jgi:hypothetical protein
MKQLPAVSPDWNEGRFFDLWMLVHVLAGFAGGFSNVFFGLSKFHVVVLGLGLMVTWEVGEVAMGVFESGLNRALDVAVGLTGLAVAVALAPLLTPLVQRVIFVVTTALALIGMTLGVRDYKRRKAAAEGKSG